MGVPDGGIRQNNGGSGALRANRWTCLYTMFAFYSKAP